MKEVVCGEEKCKIESMPKINQRGRGSSGLNPEGSSYLIPFHSSSTLKKGTKSPGRPRRRRQVGGSSAAK